MSSRCAPNWHSDLNNRNWVSVDGGAFSLPVTQLGNERYALFPYDAAAGTTCSPACTLGEAFKLVGLDHNRRGATQKALLPDVPGYVGRTAALLPLLLLLRVLLLLLLLLLLTPPLPRLTGYYFYYYYYYYYYYHYSLLTHSLTHPPSSCSGTACGPRRTTNASLFQSNGGKRFQPRPR